MTERVPLRDAFAAWRAGVREACPERALRAWLRAHPQYDPGNAKTLVVATGKAAGSMARALGGNPRGFVLVPPDADVAGLPASLEILVGSHPVPSESGIEASRAVVAAVSALGPEDHLLYLVSGGTSSLFEVPRQGLASSDVIEAYRVLIGSGATIGEINTVRRALSAIKGGGLLRAAYPARVTTLAVSDVIGDDAATIGSGPTVAVDDPPRAALGVLQRYDLERELPEAVLDACRGDLPGTAVVPATARSRASYEIVVSVAAAERAAEGYLSELGYQVLEPPLARLEGEAAEVEPAIAGAISASAARTAAWAFVMGGETTVRVPGSAGVGGRNSHMAALLARDIAGLGVVACMVGGTDGRDGNSDAVGGLVHGRTAALCENRRVDLCGGIARFDTGSVLGRCGAAVRTGPTGTNVGDLLVVAMLPAAGLERSSA